MNVYDFDNTIFRNDSTFLFVLYLFRHRPKTLWQLPRILFCGIVRLLGLKPHRWFKSNLYHMFTYVDDMEIVVDQYTTKYLDHIKAWYYHQQQPNDLVISASPLFLISSFCQKINIHYYMASNVDMHTGVITGLECHDEEKVRRYRENYGNREIQMFYSDSLHDTPLAKLAKQAFLVKGNERKPWKF